MEICTCPTVALPNIDRQQCMQNLRQVQLYAFVDTANHVAMTKANAAIMASWISRMEANGSTDTPAVVISPLVYNPASTPGEAITVGGDNTYPDGRTDIVGENPSQHTGEFHGIQGLQREQMNKLECLARMNRLGCYIFNNLGQVFGKVDSTNINPIPVSYVFVQSPSLGGMSADDISNFTLEFAPKWEKDLGAVELTKTTSSDTSAWRGADLITATVE